MNEDYKIIQSAVEIFLDKMGVSGNIDFVDSADLPLFIIQTDEAGILIGEGGKNLLSLTHILKKIVGKIFQDENKEAPQFSLDVNGYYSKKINSLKEAAKMYAQRVRFFKRDVVLDPMSAFERRVVHTVLSEYPDIKTESVGEEGVDRKIIIKFAE